MARGTKSTTKRSRSTRTSRRAGRKLDDYINAHDYPSPADEWPAPSTLLHRTIHMTLEDKLEELGAARRLNAYSMILMLHDDRFAVREHFTRPRTSSSKAQLIKRNMVSNNGDHKTTNGSTARRPLDACGVAFSGEMRGRGVGVEY